MSSATGHLEKIRRARRDLDAAVSIPLQDMDDWRLNNCQDNLEALQGQLKDIETEVAALITERQSLDNDQRNHDSLVADSALLRQVRDLLR